MHFIYILGGHLRNLRRSTLLLPDNIRFAPLQQIYRILLDIAAFKYGGIFHAKFDPTLFLFAFLASTLLLYLKAIWRREASASV